jgi:hypothetical protein
MRGIQSCVGGSDPLSSESDIDPGSLLFDNSARIDYGEAQNRGLSSICSWNQVNGFDLESSLALQSSCRRRVLKRHQRRD